MAIPSRPAASLALLAVVLLLARPSHAGMYGEHVAELTVANFDEHVIKSAETWLVKFYAPWCGHCKSSAPAFSKAAKKLAGVARLGVINCDDHQQLARRFGVQGFPTIKVFKGDTPSARRPSDYNSARSAKAFVDHVKYVMPSYVARVKPSGLEAFFDDLKALPHVLLFTDKSTTSALYKGLSATFRGKVACGEVRRSDSAPVISQYNVNSFPTLLAFPSGKTDANDAIPFSGAMDPNSLKAFFSKVADVNANITVDAATDADAPPKETVFEQPKAYSGEVVTVTDSRSYTSACAARKDRRQCALAFLPSGESHLAHADLSSAAQKYQYDNLAFAVIDSSDEGGKAYAEAFGVDATTGGFVVVRARKDKFTLMEGNVEGSAVAAFLDKVVGGDARWKKLGGALPEWKGVEEEKKAEEADGAGGQDDGTGNVEGAGEEDAGQCSSTKCNDGKDEL